MSAFGRLRRYKKFDFKEIDMTKAELGTIISKVFAIFYFFKSVWILLTNILPLLFQPEYQGEQYILAWFLISFLSFSALALGFWFGAEKLGKLIAGKNDTKTIASFSPEQFMAGVFVAFGCLLLSYAIPDVSELLAIAFSDEATQKIKMQNLNLTEKIVSIGLYSILSLLFILGANGLQRAVFMLRNLGTGK